MTWIDLFCEWGLCEREGEGYRIRVEELNKPASVEIATRNEAPRVIGKRELGSLQRDTLVWVEYKDALPGWEIDVQCYQGASEHRSPMSGDYELYLDYLMGFDEVSEYGISYRLWTDRPTDEQREATPW